MSQIINLNRFRKDKARAEKRATGDANAAKFGRDKASKLQEAADKAKSERELDGKKRE